MFTKYGILDCNFLFCFSTLKISFHCLLAPIVFYKKQSLFQIAVLCKVFLVFSSFTIMCQDVIFLCIYPVWDSYIFLNMLVAWSCLTLQLHGLQHTRLPCPSPSPGVCPNSCPLSWWCHPTILSSVTPCSSCLQSFPASGSFPMRWLLASGGQSIGASASASVLPMNIQGWFPLNLLINFDLNFLNM